VRITIDLRQLRDRLESGIGPTQLLRAARHLRAQVSKPCLRDRTFHRFLGSLTDHEKGYLSWALIWTYSFDYIRGSRFSRGYLRK
jgi:hypothetical protein